MPPKLEERYLSGAEAGILLGSLDDLSPEIKQRIIERLSEEGASVAAVIRELIVALGGNVRFKTKTRVGRGPEPSVVDVEIIGRMVEGNIRKKREQELSPEEVQRTLRDFEEAFKAGAYLHEGCEWGRVEAVLSKNPWVRVALPDGREMQTNVLWAIAQMKRAGHEPNVYNYDEDGFDIGTCSGVRPTSTSNCVYDAVAAAYLGHDAIFDGTAVETAEAMGISLMLPSQYLKQLQTKAEFDFNMPVLLGTDLDTRREGHMFIGGRDHHKVHVRRTTSAFHNRYMGWRGTLRVRWV